MPQFARIEHDCGHRNQKNEKKNMAAHTGTDNENQIVKYTPYRMALSVMRHTVHRSDAYRMAVFRNGATEIRN